MASQPAFRKLGLPLALPWERLAPVTVAVIDSGLDYRHPAFKPEALWQNPKPGAPGTPYANDLFGWDFVGRHNNPKDDIGHGTFVTGIILAVNPKARIMPLRVMNGLGHGMNSAVNRAIVYAVDRGARVVNLSVGAKGVSALSQEVVDYARERGVLIVAAGGNEGLDTAQYTPAGLRGVLTVAGVDDNDKKPNFGNWGQHVALAAPGVNIVSWRAAWSDFVHVMTAGKEPVAANVVGADRWLYRASGTSFAAPFVSGAASVLFALYPNLTAGQVARMLVESADDAEVPGWDQYTGAGRLNIARAVFADPNRYLTARIARIAPARQGAQTVVEVHGTADGNTLASYQVQLGQGESPTSWKTVAVEKDRRVVDGLVAAFPVREITARGKWSVRVIVQDTAGRVKEARGSLDVR
jgi:subtilisin family serine protease